MARRFAVTHAVPDRRGTALCLLRSAPIHARPPKAKGRWATRSRPRRSHPDGYATCKLLHRATSRCLEVSSLFVHSSSFSNLCRSFHSFSIVAGDAHTNVPLAQRFLSFFSLFGFSRAGRLQLFRNDNSKSPTHTRNSPIWLSAELFRCHGTCPFGSRKRRWRWFCGHL